MSTIRFPSDEAYCPFADCRTLHRAFHGLGCDAGTVIDILAHRNREQRTEIREVYVRLYPKVDLCKRLKSELHFNFEKAMNLWVLEPEERDALILHEAFKGRASKRCRTLTETLCLRSSEETARVADAYALSFGKPLHKEIETFTGGLCRRFFREYLSMQGRGDPDRESLDLGRARGAAIELFEAAISKGDETVLVDLLACRSRNEWLSIFEEYKKYYQEDLLKALKKTSHGEMKETGRMVLKYMKKSSSSYAKTLYSSMKGLGTDDDTLMRVVVTRAEVDMKEIKSEFIRKYKVSLERMISSDTSGNYRQFLLALIGASAHHS